eukprot:4269085-Pyramimonas_sp.AAC.1
MCIRDSSFLGAFLGSEPGGHLSDFTSPAEGAPHLVRAIALTAMALDANAMRELLQAEFKPVQDQINALASGISNNMSLIEQVDADTSARMDAFSRDVAELCAQLQGTQTRMAAIETRAAIDTAESIDLIDEDDAATDPYGGPRR